MGDPIAVESFVQSPPDGTGKKIRNFQLYALEADGTYVPVQQQAVTLVDGLGYQIDLSAQNEEIIKLLRAVVTGLSILTDTELLKE